MYVCELLLRVLTFRCGRPIVTLTVLPCSLLGDMIEKMRMQLEESRMQTLRGLVDRLAGLRSQASKEDASKIFKSAGIQTDIDEDGRKAGAVLKTMLDSFVPEKANSVTCLLGASVVSALLTLCKVLPKKMMALNQILEETLRSSGPDLSTLTSRFNQARDMFEGGIQGPPPADLDSFLGKIVTAVWNLPNNAETGLTPEKVKSIVEFYSERNVDYTTAAIYDFLYETAVKQPDAKNSIGAEIEQHCSAPSNTGTKEVDSEDPWAEQVSCLWLLWHAILDGGELVRASANGNKKASTDSVRIDGISIRGDPPPTITEAHVASPNAGCGELKLNLGRSEHSGSSKSQSQDIQFNALAGFHYAVHQCAGRVGQCINLVLQQNKKPETLVEFVEAIKDIFPVALSIGDFNAHGVVFATLGDANDIVDESDAGTDLTRLPLKIIATALSQLGPKPKQASKELREPHPYSMVVALLFPICAFLVCENSRKGKVVTVQEQRVLFNSHADGSDTDGSGADGSGADGKSKNGPQGLHNTDGRESSSNADAGERIDSYAGNNRPADSGVVESNEATLNDSTHELAVEAAVINELTVDGSVFVGSITRIGPKVAAPDWLRPGTLVVIKGSLNRSELACWRAVADCPGVPRLLSIGKGNSRVAMTPDGVRSATMADWFGNDMCIRPGRRQALGWAQQLISELIVVVKSIHDKGVVHGDLHPGNIVLMRKPHSPRDASPLVIDFGLARQLHRDDAMPMHRTSSYLSHVTVTMSVRGTHLNRASVGSRMWSPEPTDDLESVALLGEWLVGNLPCGNFTTAEDKRNLLANGCAQKRWGVDLLHYGSDEHGAKFKPNAMAKVRKPLKALNK